MATSFHSPADLPSVHRSSRQSPRIEARGTLSVRFENTRDVAVVQDIGPGGFALVTGQSVATGVQRVFRLLVRGTESLPVVARAVHCHRAERGAYVSGWVAMTSASQLAIERAMDAIMTDSLVLR